MKIAQIVCTFPPYKGGIGNSAYNFYNFFTDDNCQITTFTPQYNTQTKTDKNIKRIKPLLKYGNGAFLPQIFFQLKNFDYIYLHYPFFGTAEIIWLFKLFFKKPKLIIHYHMDVKNLSLVAKILSLPSILIRSSLFKQADKVICASSDYIKNSCIKNLYNKYPEKFCEIPFAINNKNFNYRAKKNNSTFNILFVGGLDKAHYFKGVDILLKAVAKVKLKKEWKLNIVGKGELKTYYQEQAQKLNIADKVYFNDNISNQELPEFYKQADLFILPSINNNEAFGIVLIEAMACGTPVIASNLVGVRTVFDNNEQGLFFEPQNHLELKEKIEKILNNDELKKSMEKKCLELVKQKYSLDVIKKKIKKVFI